MHLLFYHLCIKRNTYCFVIHQLPKFCHFQFNINMEVDKDICRHCNMQMILFKIKMTFNNFFFYFLSKLEKSELALQLVNIWICFFVMHCVNCITIKSNKVFSAKDSVSVTEWQWCMHHTHTYMYTHTCTHTGLEVAKKKGNLVFNIVYFFYRNSVATKTD